MKKSTSPTFIDVNVSEKLFIDSFELRNSCVEKKTKRHALQNTTVPHALRRTTEPDSLALAVENRSPGQNRTKYGAVRVSPVHSTRAQSARGFPWARDRTSVWETERKRRNSAPSFFFSLLRFFLLFISPSLIVFKATPCSLGSLLSFYESFSFCRRTPLTLTIKYYFIPARLIVRESRGQLANTF